MLMALEIAIVDLPHSPHGRAMEAGVQAVSPGLRIRWIEPSLHLPEELSTLCGVAAVAIPISVRGASRRDRFTKRLIASIETLRARGTPVFVAAGNRHSNLLAEAGVPVFAKRGGLGSSSACTIAAAETALGRAPPRGSESDAKRHP
jgi:hypothetical protein